MLAFTKHYIEDPNAPFAGLKLYPPHGFYPFHPVFDKTFAFAAQNQIPVLAHCYRGGGSYYAQDSLPPQTFGRVSLGDSDECKTFFTELNQQSDFFRKPMRQQTDVFQHPVCYYDILRKYPQLKLCLAHFGGIDEIKREGKEDTASIFERSWFSIIKDLMLEFPNVYADVSYIFGEIDKKDTIVRDTLFDPKLQDKIMFGSDYYMVVREGDENEMRQKFVDYLGNPTIWDKIAGQNVEAFLNPKPSIV
jgi:predicted TIM-barrel fold metal-dependent hydrolase